MRNVPTPFQPSIPTPAKVGSNPVPTPLPTPGFHYPHTPIGYAHPFLGDAHPTFGKPSALRVARNGRRLSPFSAKQEHHSTHEARHG